MIKTLLKISALAILPLIYLTTAKSFNPLLLIQEKSTESVFGSVYMGPFKEVEAELLKVDKQSRQAKFTEIASHFENELRLSTIDELVESASKQSRLRSGELVALSDENESIAYAISGTDLAIAISTLESDAQELVRMASGPVYLFRLALSEIPNGELQSSTQALQARFGWVVNYLPPKELVELTSNNHVVSVW